MYLYKIGYYSPEDSSYTEMQHRERFTAEELNTLVVRAIERVLRGALEGEYDPFLHCEGPSYSDIDKYVIEELKEDGFVPVEYTERWDVFGWPSLTRDNDWDAGTEDKFLLKEILKNLSPELVSKINKKVIENNKREDEELDCWVRENGLDRS